MTSNRVVEPDEVRLGALGLSLPLWVVLLCGSVVYALLTTDDIYLARIPLKIFLVAATVVAWWFSSARSSLRSDYPLADIVLILAVVIPVVWTGVALVRGAIGNSIDGQSLTYIAQHASRFGYLILYFPLVDMARAYPRRWQLVFLVPVFLLCAATVAIWGYHIATDWNPATTEVFIFKGVIGMQTEGFRVFIGNQVVLILAMAIFVASCARPKFGLPQLLGLAFLLFTAYLARTRGIWLGLSVATLSVAFLILLQKLNADWRRRIAVVAMGGLGIAIVAGILVLVGVRPAGFLDDASTGSRIEQAPALWNGFKSHPVLGAGLGGILDSDVVRSEDNPWSFELTYLQVLFQMGIVGTALLIGSFAIVARRAGRDILANRAYQELAVAGLAGTAGIMAASATNPYLFSAFGMVSIAIAFAMISSEHGAGRPSSAH